MTTEAMIGHGTKFEIFDPASSPPAWVEVAEILNVTAPTLSRDTVDATHSASEEQWREFIPGLRDGGEVTFEMNFIPKGVGMAVILSSFNRKTVEQARITFPDGDQNASPPTATRWNFGGFITNFAPAAPVDGKMSASVSFKVSGKPQFLAA